MAAVNTRAHEVELTETLLRQLERWTPHRELAPRSLEIYLQIHAKSREALDQGEWSAVIGQNCGSPQAGRTFGRFFDLLDTQGHPSHTPTCCAHDGQSGGYDQCGSGRTHQTVLRNACL